MLDKKVEAVLFITCGYVYQNKKTCVIVTVTFPVTITHLVTVSHFQF